MREVVVMVVDQKQLIREGIVGNVCGNHNLYVTFENGKMMKVLPSNNPD